MAVAAKGVVGKVSGAANAVTGEATTSLGSGDRYQVTNTARRRWSPSVAVTVKDDGNTLVAGTDYTFDYLFGIVDLVTTPAGAVTVDGSYLTMLALPELRAYDLSLKANLLDKTSMDSAGWRQFLQGLLSGNGSLEFLGDPLADLDGVTGGVQSLFSYLTNDTPKLLELLRGSQYFCAWVTFEELADSAQVDELVVPSLAWTLDAQRAGAAAGFGT